LAWIFSGQIVAFAITFSGSLIIARLLSPHEMGVYAIAAAIAGFISVISTMGLGAYLIREVDLTDERRSAVFTVNALINVSISAILFMASFLGARYWGDTDVTIVMRLLCVPPLIAIFEFLPSTLVQREMAFRITSLILMSATALNVTLTVTLAVLGFSSLSMPYAAIVAALFRAGLFNILVPQHVFLRISFTGWRPILVFGLRMITVSGVAQMTQRVCDIIIGAMLGLAALGLYSRASNLAALIFQNVYGTATGVIFAQLSKTFRETGELRAAFLRGLEMILAIMWPFLIGLAILAQPMVHILYGVKWQAAAEPLSLLMIAQFIVLSFGMNWELFVLRDETARQTRYEIARSVAGLGLFALGSLFGLSAATAGRIGEAAVGAAVYLPHMSRLSGASLSEFRRVYVQSVLLTVVAVTPSLVLMIWSGWSPETSPVLIALAVFSGIGLWAATLKRLRHPLLYEIHQILERVRHQHA
jgi:O-antigen/teichoic acid export membrane protein